MDTETYDQTDLGPAVLGDALRFMAPNSTCQVLFHGESPLLVELPAAAEVTVVDTAPGVKGANPNQYKDAVCDTGLKTQVPPFIAQGERIKVSTEDGSYLSRV
jgi:elongation factor P